MLAVDRHFVFVAGESVKLVNEDVIERFFVTVFEHLLELLAVVVCAGGSAVDIGADNNDAVSLREFPSYPYLAFYRLFGLVITAVPGIDCSCFHVVPPKSFWSIVGIKLAAFLRL